MPTYPQSIAAQLAALVTEVHRGTAPEAAGLRDLIDSACEHVPGAQYVGITMADHADGITTVAASHRYPALLDEIQQRYQEGPCVSAAWEHATICIRDLETDHRWPRYRHEVLSQSPIRSVMAFELFADGPTMGALNFYAERPHAFDQESVELGLVFATHISLAWAVVRRQEQFRSALASRDLIGQAKGMIMERYRVDAVHAFELLKRLSQISNSKVVDVAQALIAAEFPPPAHHR
ncbi:GAF and ANTAR domain-containing protein [Mycolicibacterium fluoranthenivorans]|uniref:GAF domain-containing protein n=1 Tax=Mycolicibacterium fluoranthenivorans TaxID=258505 RepID=A0A7X5TYK3_9MYCO|nr:GAF and ANTAR domain-containing protein [Mycolicibacterium fluoranthenivorans]MCV7358968.1 GAF and ANTAR domain-containing protein [Mycolicibacterium fluoranthenivorans]NIH95090.1 GAF domain-containing protein [Mycolicibacterium fluoranthenivorans]